MRFVCDFDGYGSEMELFSGVQRFLVEEMGTNPPMVFSSGLNKGDRWRLCWNRAVDRARGRSYREVVRRCGRGMSAIYEEVGAVYYVFPLGGRGDQVKSFVFSSSRLLGGAFSDRLGRFLKTAYGIVAKFQSVDGNLAYRDDVTGLYNQRKLYKDLDTSVKNFRIYDCRFYVFFLDIDRFKEINDNYGHLVGTRILLSIAKVLKEVLRENDLVYRYGGDEFVIIIPDVDHERALGIGRRILDALESRHFGIDGFRLSVSIGTASFPADAKTKEEVLDIADRMMYRAKENGRGRLCHARELFAG